VLLILSLVIGHGPELLTSISPEINVIVVKKFGDCVIVGGFSINIIHLYVPKLKM
jgi:hypothetical protein